MADYRDYLRVRDLELWDKNSKAAKAVRKLAYEKYESYTTYRSYIETRSAGTVANIMICLIHQTNYLLNQQLRALEKAFVEKGGMRDRITRARLTERAKPKRNTE